MKLFLCSRGFPTSSQKALEKLVDKPIKEISVLYVTNAKDLNPSPPGYYGTKEEIASVVGNLEPIDLREFEGRDKLFEQKVLLTDVLWFGGGNTYYLRYILKKTKLDTVTRRLVRSGVIYAGTSAGAIIAGPTLKYFDRVDDPEDVPDKVEEGLALVDFVPIPHWGDKEYIGTPNTPREIRHELLTKSGFRTVPLRDGEAIVVTEAGEELVS